MNSRRMELLGRRGARVDLLELAASVGATLRREGAEHVGPCPICGGDRSVRHQYRQAKIQLSRLRQGRHRRRSICKSSSTAAISSRQSRR